MHSENPRGRSLSRGPDTDPHQAGLGICRTRSRSCGHCETPTELGCCNRTKPLGLDRQGPLSHILLFRPPAGSRGMSSFRHVRNSVAFAEGMLQTSFGSGTLCLWKFRERSVAADPLLGRIVGIFQHIAYICRGSDLFFRYADNYGGGHERQSNLLYTAFRIFSSQFLIGFVGYVLQFEAGLLRTGGRCV